jgi:hypothetical protein
MSNRRLALLGVAVGAIVLWLVPVAGQAPGGAAPKTPWGVPDLQGIWDDNEVTPFERDKAFGTREFLTDQERKDRASTRVREIEENKGRDRRDASAERDVAGAYNAIWQGVQLTTIGKRTSAVIDPPDGRLPPLTAAVQKSNKEYRDFQLELLRSTDTCKRKLVACRDGKYDPTPTPRRHDVPPVYNLERINRSDNVEDNAGGVRCLGGQLPAFGALQRIVQSPEAVSVYYDQGQGGGFSRLIPISNQPHVPETVRMRYGDARGKWEGDTLVVDITNFTQKTNFRGSRQNLHLIERYRRVDANTLEYKITVDDPTTWTRPWTAVIEMYKQDEKKNEIYQQTCHEGNYGLLGIMANFRAIDLAFAEGRRGDPLFEDNASPGGGGD